MSRQLTWSHFIGLLLCSEGNTEHNELLMLDEQNIKEAPRDKII
jgi:hypothetical protein